MRRAKAFTMLELITVVIIIAVLAAIAVPNFLEAQIRSKTTQVVASQQLVAAALESYYVDFKAYPPNAALVDFEITVPKVEKREQTLEAASREDLHLAVVEWEREMRESRDRAAAQATTGTVQVVKARWNVSTKPSREVPSHREVLLCNYCKYYNPLVANRCFVCGTTLQPSDKTDVYNLSLDGAVLDALTTPIPYLPQNVNLDIYAQSTDTRRPSWSWHDGKYARFCYVNFTQIEKTGLDLPDVPGKARYVIISQGPDLTLQFTNRYPVPSFVDYDPTNGTVSPGDIITWHN